MLVLLNYVTYSVFFAAAFCGQPHELHCNNPKLIILWCNNMSSSVIVSVQNECFKTYCQMIVIQVKVLIDS